MCVVIIYGGCGYCFVKCAAGGPVEKKIDTVIKLSFFISQIKTFNLIPRHVMFIMKPNFSLFVCLCVMICLHVIHVTN